MTILLKDLPEFKEKIESAWTLRQEIIDLVQQTDLTSNADDFDGENEFDFECSIEAHDAQVTAEEILKVVTDFINENYIPIKK